MTLTPFDPMKAQLRADYVGNECDTDEYRETQPEKGLDTILHLGHLLHEDHERRQQLLELTEVWVQTAPNAEPYGGCEELEPILGLYFDVLWERGEHPYYGEESELAEWLAEQHDWQVGDPVPVLEEQERREPHLPLDGGDR